MHLEQFPSVPAEWRNDALAEKWEKIKDVRRVVTGALEIARAEKRIGSSLEAVPSVFLDTSLVTELITEDGLAEVAITSDLKFSLGDVPAGAFTLHDAPGVAVVVRKAEDLGLRKCARSWRYTDDVGSNPEFPDVSARDAAVLHDLRALGRL